MPNDPHEQLKRVVREPGAPLSLARGALEIARLHYPKLSVERYLERIRGLAEWVDGRCAGTEDPAVKLQQLNQVLFYEYGLAPNNDDYYSPDNSYLNRVLDERKGIPVTLSILHIETGRLLGLDLHGISFPGHFLVRANLNDQQVILDPFNRGSEVSDKQLTIELRRNPLLQRLQRRETAQLLTNTATQEVLIRVLRNLVAIWLQAGKPEQALHHINAALEIKPDQPLELRNRGLVYEQLECFNSALEDLQRALILDPASEEHEMIKQKIATLQKKVRPLH